MTIFESGNHPLLYIGFIYLLWKAVENFTNKNENEPEEEEMRLLPDLTNKTEYYVNDRKVAVGLTYYYLGLLRLFGEKKITEEMIRQAYVSRFNEKQERSVDIIDDLDIRAAKLYMLDRWKYLAFKN